MIKLEYWDSFILFYMKEKFRNKKEDSPLFESSDRMFLSAMRDHIIPIIPEEVLILDRYLYLGIINKLQVFCIPYNNERESELFFNTHNNRIQKQLNDPIINTKSFPSTEWKLNYKIEINQDALIEFTQTLITAWKEWSYSTSIKFKPKKTLELLTDILKIIKSSDDWVITRISIKELCKASENYNQMENGINKLTINFLKDWFCDYFGVLLYLESIELIEFGIVNELNFNFEIYIKMKQVLSSLLDTTNTPELAKLLFNYNLQWDDKAIIEIWFNWMVLNFWKWKKHPLREGQPLLITTIFKLFNSNDPEYQLTYDEILECLEKNYDWLSPEKRNKKIRWYKQSIKNLVIKIEKDYWISNFFIRINEFIKLNPEYIYNTELG